MGGVCFGDSMMVDVFLFGLDVFEKGVGLVVIVVCVGVDFIVIFIKVNVGCVIYINVRQLEGYVDFGVEVVVRFFEYFVV